MSWAIYAVALLVVYLLHGAVVHVVELPALDLFLVLALTVALITPLSDGRLGAFFAGLAQDFGASAGPLGPHAFCLGLTGLLITALRDWANLGRWWVRIGVCFVAAWPGQFLYLLHRDLWTSAAHQSWWTLLSRSFSTAAVAAVIVALLTALPQLNTARRRARRAHSLG